MEPQRYQSCIEACNTCADACDYLSSAKTQSQEFGLSPDKKPWHDVGAIFRLLALGSRL